VIYLGFDPGTVKCGLAVVDGTRRVLTRAVLPVDEVLTWVGQSCENFPIAGLILGDQTGSRDWQERLERQFPRLVVHRVNERFSSQEARTRYWDFYPAGWQVILPRGLRIPPTSYDDIVAVVLVERFLSGLE